MTISSPSGAQATSKRLVTWILISLLCVTTALGNNDGKIFDELKAVSENYGILPNVRMLIDLASTTTSPHGVLHLGGYPCLKYIILGDHNVHTFEVTREMKFCTALFRSDKLSKLTFEVSGLNLFPCDEEYLYINDGATLESTLCDGKASVASRGSRFLLVQYGRQTKTGTAFNITVKAVPVVAAIPEIIIKNRLVEQGFLDGQICSACGYSGRARRGRIIEGYPARTTEFPWMVGVHISLKSTDPNSATSATSMCGASVLDRRHVLTAAHCIEIPSTHKFPRIVEILVVAGSDVGFSAQKIDGNSQKIKVEAWYSHPSYDPDFEGGKSYDIAVLRLSEELQFSDRVAPVCLAAPMDFLGSDVTVTGYGFVLREGTTASLLQAVKLSIRHGDACDATLKGGNENFVFQSHQVCLYSPSKDACQGDSGGPAVLNWKNRSYQVGVVSFGLDCEDVSISMRHGGYTRVSSFIPWIKSVLQGNFTC